MNDKELISLALAAIDNAYAPYSGFKVGAALLCKNGKVYTGCNVENSSFGATNCAERTAVFKAISEGERDFSTIAIVGGKGGIVTDHCYPCGVCRQVLAEFCDGDFEIIVAMDVDNYRKMKLSDLLPFSFSSDMIN